MFRAPKRSCKVLKRAAKILQGPDPRATDVQQRQHLSFRDITSFSCSQLMLQIQRLLPQNVITEVNSLYRSHP